MTLDAKSHWDKSHKNHPIDRSPSNYCIDKEKSFPKNSIICDLGGGDGTDSIYFIKKGHIVFLYDISNLALKRADEKAGKEELKSKLKIAQTDLAVDKIPAQNNFFDILYSRLSLHYFLQERTIEILKEIYRVLKNNGTAYIVVKSPEDIKEMEFLKSTSKEQNEGEFIDNNGMVKTRFTKKQYEDMLEKAGIVDFEINKYTEYFGEQKIYVKSKADNLLYLELIIRKP